MFQRFSWSFTTLKLIKYNQLRNGATPHHCLFCCNITALYSLFLTYFLLPSHRICTSATSFWLCGIYMCNFSQKMEGNSRPWLVQGFSTSAWASHKTFLIILIKNMRVCVYAPECPLSPGCCLFLVLTFFLQFSPLGCRQQTGALV